MGERKWIRSCFWECWSTLPRMYMQYIYIYSYLLTASFPYIPMYCLWWMFMCKTHYYTGCSNIRAHKF
jgi:hypothetical protein